MTDRATNRSRKSKIEIRNYGEVIDEEILRLQEILSSIDATPADSVISKSKEAIDNKNIEKKTAVKRKETIHSKKSSKPKHTANLIAPQDDDIIKHKISKIVPVPKKCLGSNLDASRDSSLDEYKQDKDMEIITDTVNEQNVIEIIDSDEDDEVDGIIDIKTEIFEVEENKLQKDEYLTNSMNKEENAVISMNYDNVDNEQTENTDNFNIAKKMTYNNDINAQQENVDDEYEKELYSNIKQAPEECDQGPDSEDLEIMKQVNGYEFFLSKVFEASKFANASNILDDNVEVTDSAEIANGDDASSDSVGVTDSAETDNGDAALLDNVGGTDSAETDNVVPKYASLDGDMLQTVISNIQSTDYTTLKPNIVCAEEMYGAFGKIYICCVCSTHIIGWKNITLHNDAKRHLIEHLYEDAYMEKIDKEQAVLRCQICNLEYSKMNHYKLHMREHASLPHYTCTVCNRSFSESGNLRRHMKMYKYKRHPSLPTIYRCKLCNKSFSIQRNFIRHKKMHKLKVVTCTLCNKKFQGKGWLENHMINVH